MKLTNNKFQTNKKEFIFAQHIGQPVGITPALHEVRETNAKAGVKKGSDNFMTINSQHLSELEVKGRFSSQTA